jgi:hypothetical protein
VAVEWAATDKRAVDAATVKKVADNAAVVEWATVEVDTQREAESSPSLVVGAKRAVVSGGSTPPPNHHSVAPGSHGMLRDSVVVLPFSICVFCFTGILHCVVCLLPVGRPPLGVHH